MTHKYEIINYWRQEDQSFIAEAPELAGCMADGKTCKEALSNVETIIDEWIETAMEQKTPHSTTKRKVDVCITLARPLEVAFTLAPTQTHAE